MKTRWLILLLALTGSAVALLGCPGANNCSSSNCNGCCDSNGTCVNGTSTSQCGRSGASCTACSSGLACVANACTSAMGGGGGTTGGGGGTTGGGTGGGGGTTDAGCTMVDFTNATGLGGSFTPAASNGNPAYNAGFLGVPSATANRFDYLGVELWYFGSSANPTFPYQFVLAPTTYQDCEVCLIYQEACDNMGGNCARSYLGQGGTVNFTTATRNERAGQFASTGQNVRLQEWDLQNDTAASGNRCVQLSYAMDVTWDAGVADAGMGDAGTGDAGLGDAGLDAGLGDAGTDAGIDAGMDAGVDGGSDAGLLPDGGTIPDGGVLLPDGGILLPDGGTIP